MSGNDHPSVVVTKDWNGRLIAAVFVAFGLLIGVMFGASYRDLRNEVGDLEDSVGDLSIRIARLERVAGTRDVGDNLTVRVDRLEELAVLYWRLDSRDGPIRRSGGK